MQCLLLASLIAVSSAVGVELPACPKAIFEGFCHPWELQNGGVACVRDLAKITKPSDVQCVPKENGGASYSCPSWAPVKCQPVYSQKNIVDLAAGTPDLSTLVIALKAGKLTDALSGKGPFTVFAPTNEAFAKLPKSTLNALLDPQNIKKLDQILEYHVVAGAAVFKADIRNGETVKTLEGQNVKATISSKRVFINQAEVTTADVHASNGVVHIIDAVLMPPAAPSPAPSPATLPACPAAIFEGFCHPWELQNGGVACVRDTAAKITKPSDVQCVPKKNGGSSYKCPSWVPVMCQPVYDQKNIVDLAAGTPDLSTLVTALKAGKLTGALSSKGPFTVFAPTNEAFAKLPKSTLEALLDPKNIKELDQILEYHVVADAVFKADIRNGERVRTLEGQDVKATISSKGVFVNQAKVITADVHASNGVVHIIDAVLMPAATPTPAPSPAPKNIVELAESVKDLSTLVAAVVAGGLADTLSSPGPFTVFAPTDEAFAALPAGTLTKLMKAENKKELVDILTYHVLPRKVLSRDLKPDQEVKTIEGKLLQVTRSTGGIQVGASSSSLKKVIAADNVASNGVVHIIDGVLLPPKPAPPTPKVKNIVELAESNTDLSILVSALVAGDLADTLSSKGPFTVFAPTNEAFKALPTGTLDKLMKPKNKRELVDILTYHVLPEKVLSKDLKPFQAVATIEGKLLHVTKWDGKVRVGASLESKDLRDVSKADNLASNGVVHIIDGVLLPPSGAILV